MKQITPNEEPTRRTAERILIAARKAFSGKGFFAATVDEIAVAAGLSRATVYLHYRSKDEMLIDLLRENLAAQLEVYAQLASLKRATASSIRKWLLLFRRELDEQRGSLNLFATAGALDLRLEPYVVQHRDNIIDLLGQRFPAFDLDALPRAARERQKAHCIMMMFLIEGVAVHFSERAAMPSVSCGVDILAPMLLHFINHGQIRSE